MFHAVKFWNLWHATFQAYILCDGGSDGGGDGRKHSWDDWIFHKINLDLLSQLTNRQIGETSCSMRLHDSPTELSFFSQWISFWYFPLVHCKIYMVTCFWIFHFEIFITYSIECEWFILANLRVLSSSFSSFI